MHGRTTDLSSVKTIKPDWLKPGSGFRVLVQFARETRHPDFPDVPTARELARNEAARDLIELSRAAVTGSRGRLRRRRRSAGTRQGAARRPSPPRIAIRSISRRPTRLNVDVSPVSADEVVAARSNGSRKRRHSYSTISGSCSPRAGVKGVSMRRMFVAVGHGCSGCWPVAVLVVAANGASRRRCRFLPRQAGQSDRELRNRRRLRCLCASARQVHEQAHSRQPEHHHPEHAGRRIAARRELHLLMSLRATARCSARFARNIALIGQLKTNQNVNTIRPSSPGSAPPQASPTTPTFCFVRRDAKVKSIEDVRRAAWPAAHSRQHRGGRLSDAMGVLLREWLGFNLKVIPGYTDSGVLFLAIERSEVEGRTVGLSSVRANKPDWLKPNGLGRVMVVFGRSSRLSDYPDVPMARELAKSPAIAT